MYKILIVEDDEKLREELAVFLKKNGYEVQSLSEFENAVEAIIKINPSLLLLDINLPQVDGQYICREVRKQSEIPIVMITSRNTQLDELISFNNGADDFITKPFHTQILLAKIAAILKRVYKTGEKQSKLEVDGLVLDISKSKIQKEEQEIELTKNELKILYYLMTNHGRIVSREEIMDDLWESQMYVDDNTLTVNINRLRKKLEEIGVADQIETKRGQGYLLK